MLKLQTALALFALLAVPALADTRIRYVDEKTGETTSQLLVKDGKVRMDNARGNSYTLFDAATNTLTIVNPSEGTYQVLDEAALDRMSGQMNDAMAEMRKQLEQMPAEQRKMMEKMMGGAMNMGKSMIEMKVDRTGKTLEKAGYDCRQVFLSIGTIGRQELCVVDQGSIEINGEDRETLDAMQAYMRKFAEKMSQGMGVNVIADYDSLGGFPVYMKQDRERTGQVLDEVTRVEIEAAELAVPAGYRQETIGVE